MPELSPPSPLSPRQRHASDPLLLLLGPDVGDSFAQTSERERPGNIPGHDSVDKSRGQEPQAHDFANVGFVEAELLCKGANVLDLAFVDVPLPAESPR